MNSTLQLSANKLTIHMVAPLLTCWNYAYSKHGGTNEQYCGFLTCLKYRVSKPVHKKSTGETETRPWLTSLRHPERDVGQSDQDESFSMP